MSIRWVYSGLIAFICLIILVVILFKSINELRQTSISRIIKFTYFSAIIFSIITVTHGMIEAIYQYTLGFMFLSVIFYTLVVVFVLILLLLRLYFTFKGSMLAISQCQQYLFIISTISVILAGFMLSIYFIFDIPLWIELINFGVAMLIYFGIGIYAMVLFIKKLHTLIRSTNKHNDDNNQSQRKLLINTTKYVSLLSVAMISSWITLIINIVNIVLPRDALEAPEVANFIDCVINIICLYLQYPFAEGYYKKYCNCLRNCCVYLMMTKPAADGDLVVESKTVRNDGIQVETGRVDEDIGNDTKNQRMDVEIMGLENVPTVSTDEMDQDENVDFAQSGGSKCEAVDDNIGKFEPMDRNQSTAL